MRDALTEAGKDNNDSVLFSFHVSPRDGWVWAVDRNHTSVYRVPSRATLESEVSGFVAALRRRDPATGPMGAQLYRELFGAVAPDYLRHRRWLLELDGPLFDLPFGALTSGPVTAGNGAYLAETKIVEAIPSALLFERTRFGQPDPAGQGEETPGGFLGVGDPIYNAADSRYHGDRTAVPDSGLPRLPATAGELDRCSREWGSPNLTILTGADANSRELAAALRKEPDILHFATHVIPSPEKGAGGMIALSIDGKGNRGSSDPPKLSHVP